MLPKENQKCIINTDLDGLFSGLLLHNFLNWEIVGFCDSKESIWVDRNRVSKLSDCVFIDIFLFPENLKCIDQHIVAVDTEHHETLVENTNKLNPNLLNERTFLPDKSYYKKYPFGTVHFIIAWLERNGIEVKLDFSKIVTKSISSIDLLLRADDAFKTSTFSNYTDNATEWWDWLKDYSKNGEIIRELINYIQKFRKDKSRADAKNKKDAIAELLQSKPFYCDSPDGGFKEGSSLGGGFLKTNVKEYFRFIADAVGLKCFNLDFSYSQLKGNAVRTKLNEKQLQQLREGVSEKNLFSYAFVRSSKRSDNFSFTLLDIKDWG